MARTTEVFCTLSFDAIHNWADCPIEEVTFLRHPHRHMFHVKAWTKVLHDDRDVEFINLKHDILEYIDHRFTNAYLDLPTTARVYDLKSMSCEMIAEVLMDQFSLSRCEVSEDNENGAIVTEDTINV